MLFTSYFSFSQISFRDTIAFVLNSDLSDTSKIDKINGYITKYAQNDAALALIFSDTAISFSSRIKDSIRLAHSYSRKGIET